MPRIRSLISIAGSEYAFAPGEEVDVRAELAAELTSSGVAQLVRAQPIETAVKTRKPKPEPPAKKPATGKEGQR